MNNEEKRGGENALALQGGQSLATRPSSLVSRGLRHIDDVVEGLISCGRESLKTEQYDTALKFFDRVLGLKPEHCLALPNKGICLVHLKRFEDAPSCLESATENILKGGAEVSPHLWFWKGLALHYLNRFDDARMSYDRALELNSDCFEAWANKAASLSKLGRHEESLHCYARALELRPDEGGAWFGQGQELQALGRFDEAIHSYDKALELGALLFDAWRNKGAICLHQRRYVEALGACVKAIELDPTDSGAWSIRGGSLVGLGRFIEGLAACQTSCELDPENSDAWYSRARAEEQLGRERDAIDSFERLLAVSLSQEKASQAGAEYLEEYTEYAQGRLKELKSRSSRERHLRS